MFVDAYLHVPEHRRLPVFVHLLTTLGASSNLHVCLALLLEKISNKDAKVNTNIIALKFTGQCSFAHNLENSYIIVLPSNVYENFVEGVMVNLHLEVYVNYSSSTMELV